MPRFLFQGKSLLHGFLCTLKIVDGDLFGAVLIVRLVVFVAKCVKPLAYVCEITVTDQRNCSGSA